jgi:hypothetical protein
MITKFVFDHQHLGANLVKKWFTFDIENKTNVAKQSLTWQQMQNGHLTSFPTTRICWEFTMCKNDYVLILH